jgi:hypothetical protein
MAKNDQPAPLDEIKHATQSEETAAKKPTKPEYDDNDSVTVIWKSWGSSGMPRDKVSYFDRHQFVGGVGRRIPYRDAKKWKQQGHGIHILPVDAQELDFIKATGHAPMQDSELEAMLRSTPLDKLAALLGPENLDKIAAFHKK